jgi:hypothetical protein
MRIDSAGNVGIGTSAPAAALHVNSGTAAPMTLEITDTNGDFTLKSTASTPSGTIIGLRWEAKDDAGNNTVYGIIGCNVDDDSNGSEKGSISFNLANAAGGTTEQMTIEGDGKVGIGVSNPNQSLEVRGTGIRTRRTGSSTQSVPAGVQLTTFAGNWPTVGHEVFRQQGMTLVGSGGGRIRVPVAYQANLNTHWYIKLTGCAANYNSRTSNGFSGEVWGGHLSVFNINHTSVFGHLGSISGSTGSSGGNHYVNFNFNSNYDSNGAWVWWECVGQTQSIYAPNMNGMAFG